MITDVDRRSIYVANMEALSERYKGFEIARWFLLGEGTTSRCKTMRSSLNTKLREPGTPGAKNATYADALVSQLLGFLDREGFALEAMRFNPDGYLMDIPLADASSRESKGLGGRSSSQQSPECPGVSSEQRTRIYAETVTELRNRIQTRDVIRIFLLGQSEQGAKDSMRAAMYAKCRSPEAKSHKGASYPETLCVQLLKFMDDWGYNLTTMTFDEHGWLLSEELKRRVF